MEPNFREILPLLSRAGVCFILIGGRAAIAHGAARATYDVDIVYARDPENIRKQAVTNNCFPSLSNWRFSAPLPCRKLGKADSAQTSGRSPQRSGGNRSAASAL